MFLDMLSYMMCFYIYLHPQRIFRVFFVSEGPYLQRHRGVTAHELSGTRLPLSGIERSHVLVEPRKECEIDILIYYILIHMIWKCIRIIFSYDIY